MRTVALIGIILLIASVGFGQTLPKIEEELLGHLENLEKAAYRTGKFDETVLSKENQAMRSALLKYGTRSDVLSAQFTKLSDKMTITTSRDGRLRTYSWDDEWGGTMRDYITVYQFRGRSGKVYTWAEPYAESIEERGAGSFIHQIFQTDTPAGPIYLTVSTFIGSTSLAGQSIACVRINGNKLDRSAKLIKTASGLTNSVHFEYDFFSVVEHKERPVRLFSYNEEKKSFRFPIVIEDKKTPQGRVTNRYITYRFDGKYFVRE